ncbi:acyl carrier protein [Fodinicola feengrottensis]|uniref:acyl carrier protein n=1 Tax=Fodinicola feengrottensis TaxID=435914 RepID=UPI0013D381FA|nr:phosphopantetheine-binding protein [Fodinicola feengrottensis]
MLDQVEPHNGTNVVAIVGSIPTDPDGTINRENCVAIAEALERTPIGLFRYEPPADQTEVALVELLLEMLPYQRISMTDNLPMLGADSLVIVELSAVLSERFGVQVGAIELFEVRDLRGLAARLAASMALQG